MIVRDESRVIERCLRSVLPFIDGYMICDTGSTDDTIHRIETILSGLPGEIHKRPWVNFGHNRSELADLARGTADFHLLIDADMTVEVDGFLPEFSRGVAYLAHHRGEVDYLAPRIIDGSLPWSWAGSTHEQLTCAEPFRFEVLPELRIRHHADGADHGLRRLVRDRELLRQDLEADPGDERANFYLGLVLTQMGDLLTARQHLEQAAECGLLPDDARYHAAVRAAEVERRLGRDASGTARRAVRLDRERAEGWLEVARAERAAGRPRRAIRAAGRARSCSDPTAASFVTPGSSDWRADLEAALAELQAGDHRAAAGHIHDVLTRPAIPRRARTMAHELVDQVWRRTEPRVEAGRLPVQRRWRIEADCVPRWRLTNPSISADPGGFVVTAKLTNAGSRGEEYEFMDRSGRFRTLGLRIDLDGALGVTSATGILDPARSIPVAASRALGTEDLRVTSVDGRRRALGWAREFGRPDVVGPVMVDLDRDTATLMGQPDPDRHEKNWMPFDVDGQLHVVARLDPLTICRVEADGSVAPIHTSPFRGDAVTWRGGSQGVPFAEGWLFVVHERHSSPTGFSYSHRFLTLDGGLRLSRASAAFTLTGAPVEFVAGLAMRGDQLILSAGLADAEAWLFEVDPDTVERMLASVDAPPRWARRNRRLAADNPGLLIDWGDARVAAPTSDGEATLPADGSRALPARAVVHGARVISD